MNWEAPSYGEVEYFDIPNPVRHYFLNYLYQSFEGLPSMIIEKKAQDFDQDLPTKSALCHQIDGIEAECWSRKPDRVNHMLPKIVSDTSIPQEPTLTPIATIIDQIGTSLRHPVMHRDLDVPMSVIKNMLKLPALLGHNQKASEVDLVWRVVREDPTVSNAARDWGCQRALTANRPCATALQVLTRIESLTEEALFKWAKREDLDVVRSSEDSPPRPGTLCWMCPEDGDLRAWFHAFKGNPPAGTYYDTGGENLNHVEVDGRLFSQHDLRYTVLDRARDLRNVLAHERQNIDVGDVRRYALSSILLCVLIDEREIGVEIEVLAEQHLTYRARSDVLYRLKTSSDQGNDSKRYAISRVVAWDNEDGGLARKIFYARRIMSGGPARERRKSEAVGGVGGSSHQCSLAQSRRLGGDAVMRSTDELDELYLSAVKNFVWSASMHRVFKYDHNEDDDDLVEASMQENNLIRERCYPGLDSSASNADSIISTYIGSESPNDSSTMNNEDTTDLTDGSSDTSLTPTFCKQQDTQDTKNWRCIYKPSTNREERF